MFYKTKVLLAAGLLAGLATVPAQADHHLPGEKAQTTAGAMMNNGQMSSGMTHSDGMGGMAMGVMNDATKNYIAANAMGRNQMMSKMSLSDMVKFRTNLYNIPMNADMIMQLGLVQSAPAMMGGGNTPGSSVGSR